MSNAEELLTLGGSLVAVWLGLFVACVLWLGRRAVARVRHEVPVLLRGVELRTKPALLDAVEALAILSWLIAGVVAAAPLLLILCPLLLTLAGLDLTAHIVEVGH
jgi:hypothetical protein